jgi:DNA polymerase-3 subunit epsilon
MGQLELSKCLGYNVKYPRLIELHKFLFHKDFTGQHDALHDVEACARCYRELKRRESL